MRRRRVCGSSPTICAARARRCSSPGPDEAAGGLPALAPDQPEADAICLLQSFYGMALRLAGLRGTDVDRPRHLKKVTRTR